MLRTCKAVAVGGEHARLPSDRKQHEGAPGRPEQCIVLYHHDVERPYIRHRDCRPVSGTVVHAKVAAQCDTVHCAAVREIDVLV